MTLMTLFGCILIAFGPAAVIFLVAVARDHFHVIIMISSAFFWLLSLLLSSIWWTIVSPLKKDLAFGVAFSVLFQELLRYAFFLLIKKAEDSELVSLASKSSGLFKHKTAFVSGLGYGIMSGLFAMVNVLADITGPGAPGLDGESPQFLIISALLTCAFVLLNTFWGIIWFESCSRKKYAYLALVFGSHMFVSLMTLLNNRKHYLGSMMSAYIVLIIMAVLAFKVAGGSLQNLRSALARKQRPQMHNEDVTVVSPTT
ncbi:gamma-secretase subunit Aph-1-like [Dendronephthya gigantea]|uniref:gamma-secretase subunit Aph-1-like n=1 Tax=Dendronephthya gigantea TaxID=151771 RepID=UPI001069E99C|nr:gamma-secretase subunit Aph-1-like [Dendronephthya gigantea]